MSSIDARNYAHPDVLVSTDWVAEHLHDPAIRLVESNEDTLLYAAGHIPGAVHVDWTSDLNDQIRRDYVGREAFNALMSRIGITRATTVVFYGDRNNWWACYAFWVFQLFGHTRAKVMDGGRLKWEKEGRSLTRDVPHYPATTYDAPERKDAGIRAFRDEVLEHSRGREPSIPTTARSRAPRSCARSTPGRTALPRTKKQSRTAASGSAAATRGSR
jgi:thiosulfate/3-mercaptopyruvate sulfurtransferase